ncbi:MAG: ECF-type sigma factor [Planctomycetota bacterium]
METGLQGEITRILQRFGNEDRNGIAEVVPLVYEELYRLAIGQMARERADHTLQPTALINEAFLRLSSRKDGRFNDRRHFYRTAALIMRSILINHARDRKRIKRGAGAAKLPLDDAHAAFEERAVDLLALDEALTKLAAVDARQAEMIELRFFGGLTIAETAEVLGVSERTVQGDWVLARAWLLREIRED